MVEHRSIEQRLVEAEATLDALRLQEVDAIIGRDDVLLLRLRQAEAALRESEERFRTMADHSPVIIWVTDQTGKLLFINQACRIFCGVTDEDVHEGRWERFVHPDDRDTYIVEFLRCVRERTAFSARCRMKRADGEWRWVSACGTPRFSEDGTFLGHVGSSPEIHELISVQQSLQASEERLRLALTAGEMGTWDINLETGTLIWDAKQLAIFGRTPDDVPKNLLEFYSLIYCDDVSRIKQAGATAEHTGRFSEEFRIIRSDGAIRWIASYGAIISSPAGCPARMVGINYDITELKESQEKMQRFAEELEHQVEKRTRELAQSQERLRALTAEMALTEQRERQKLARDLHDNLAQLLAIGHIKISMAKNQPGATAWKEVDDILQRASTYTRTLMADLSPPSFRDFGLPAALQWLTEQMDKYGLRVVVESNKEQVPLSEEQAVLVFLSVRELLMNVLKHAGVEQATVHCVVEEQEVRVIVDDRGRGFNVDTVHRPIESGHLGLASVRERIASLNGRVELSTAIGEGTTVTLTVPRKVKSIEDAGPISIGGTSSVL